MAFLFFVSCPRGEKKKMHNSEFSIDRNDSIVKGGEASPTLDKLEFYRGGPQTVLNSSHIDLFPILLRC